MGKPFVFRLEKVLEYRRQLEDQARMTLASAQARHKAQEEVLRDVETRLADHVERGFGAKATQADIWLWMQRMQIACSGDRRVGGIICGRDPCSRRPHFAVSTT